MFLVAIIAFLLSTLASIYLLFDDRLSDEARHALHGARRRCGTCWAPARAHGVADVYRVGDRPRSPYPRWCIERVAGIIPATDPVNFRPRP